MVQRLAKGVLPANTSIQKDALLALSKSATVFVNYLSGSANDNAQRANKKTIQPRDVFDAVHDLEFDGFMERLEQELIKYNAVQCDKRNTYRRKVKEEQLAQKAAAAKEALEGAAPEGEKKPEAADEDGERAAKKVRVEGGEAVAVGEEDDDDVDMDHDQGEDEQDDDENEEDVEDDDAEEEDADDAHPEDQLVEDPLEEREEEGVGDEALEGEESD